eukprot:13285515-Alexandrium_andersonii.AAC.1
MPPPMAAVKIAGDLVEGLSRMRTRVRRLRSLRASCMRPIRLATARRGPSAQPVTTWERGWSGVITTSPPRAAGTAVVA